MMYYLIQTPPTHTHAHTRRHTNTYTRKHTNTHKQTTIRHTCTCRHRNTHIPREDKGGLSPGASPRELRVCDACDTANTRGLEGVQRSLCLKPAQIQHARTPGQLRGGAWDHGNGGTLTVPTMCVIKLTKSLRVTISSDKLTPYCSKGVVMVAAKAPFGCFDQQVGPSPTTRWNLLFAQVGNHWVRYA